MRKPIATVLIITLLFCFSGCKKSHHNSSSMSAASNEATESSSLDTSTKQDTSSKQNTSTKQDVSQNDKVSSSASNEKNRPERITKIYSDSFNFTVADPLKKIFYDTENGNKLPYCLYVPNDYSPLKEYPVILFLHGAGEIGNNNSSQLNGIRNMFAKNKDFISQSFLICPQTAEWWNLDRQSGDRKGTLTSAMNLLKKIQKEYSCDSDRIYLTGLSMGGYATWELLEHYGDIFAAGVPLCGYGNPYNGGAFKNIPIRIYHGTEDRTVSFSQSQQMYNSIISAGGKKIELYPLEGYSHDVWNYAYGNRDLFSWMFAQNKSQNKSAKYEYVPYFKIVDSMGKTVIEDSDILYTSFSIDAFGEEKTEAEIYLNNDSLARLNQAYMSSGGKEFTVYFSTKKFYSFTATKPFNDDFFLMTDVFNADNYNYFSDMLNMATTK